MWNLYLVCGYNKLTIADTFRVMEPHGELLGQSRLNPSRRIFVALRPIRLTNRISRSSLVALGI